VQLLRLQCRRCAEGTSMRLPAHTLALARHRMHCTVLNHAVLCVLLFVLFL
jgi:hypothetical protein